LLDELRNRGVNVEDVELSYAVPDGRLQPDAIFKDTGQYFLELEVGKTTKIFDGLKQAGKYIRNLPCEGAFVVLLPEYLRTPMPRQVLEDMAQKTKCEAVALYRDLRIISPFEGKLASLADWIAREILTPPERRTLDTQHVIQILRRTVEYVSIGMSRLKMEELEEIFGGRSIFENILQYEQQEYPIEQLRKAVTYLLINQIIFYAILSNEQPESYEPLDETKLKRPGDLMRYFGRVLKVDYRPVFGFDVVQKFPQDYLGNLKDAVSAIKELHPEKIRYDLLGKIFHDLIPFDIRKSVAAFYTNNEAAEFLANLSVEKADDSVIDLACGSGTLLVAAYHRKRALLEADGTKFSPQHHERFVEEDLTGIDIMPFAAHLAVVHLSLQGPIYPTEKVRVAVWDSTHPTIRPGNVIPSLSRELKAAYRAPKLEGFFESNQVTIPTDPQAYLEKGVLTLDKMGGEEIALNRTRVVIMNPPFTRQERLPPNYKKALLERFSEYSTYLHGQMGLWGYFTLLADRFVDRGGRLALVLPGRFLRAKSGSMIRQLLVGSYHIMHLVSSTGRSAFSESASYRDILLVARKLRDRNETKPIQDDGMLTSVTMLHKLPDNLLEARDLAEKIKSAETEFSTDTMSRVILTRKNLIQNVNNWFVFISAFNPKTAKLWAKFYEEFKDKLILADDYFSKFKLEVIRGVETKRAFGLPFFAMFAMSDPSHAKKKYDNWIVKTQSGTRLVLEHRTLGTTLNVPRNSFWPAVRRASGMATIDISEQLDFVAASNFKDLQTFVSPFKPQRIIRNMATWRSYLKSRLANLLISRRFNIAVPGTKLLAFYSQTPTTGQNLWSIRGLNEDEAKIQALWFNSTFNLLHVYLNRTESEGPWMEINEYSLGEGYFLNLDAFTRQQKTHLLETFEKVGKKECPSILDQLGRKPQSRVEIDKAIMKGLGADESTADSFLASIYDLLFEEISQLKFMVTSSKMKTPLTDASRSLLTR